MDFFVKLVKISEIPAKAFIYMCGNLFVGYICHVTDFYIYITIINVN